jgi:hypothetical protein
MIRQLFDGSTRYSEALLPEMLSRGALLCQNSPETSFLAGKPEETASWLYP